NARARNQFIFLLVTFMASKSIEWLEKAISEQFINQYNYEEFYGYQILGEGASGEVRKFEWKNYNLMVVHKSLKGFTEMDEMNEEKIKTLVKEQYELALHIEKLHMNASSDDNLIHKVSLHQSDQNDRLVYIDRVNLNIDIDKVNLNRQFSNQTNDRFHYAKSNSDSQLIHKPSLMSDYSLPYDDDLVSSDINYQRMNSSNNLVSSDINYQRMNSGNNLVSSDINYQRMNSGNNLIRSRTTSDKSEKESPIDKNSINTNSDTRSTDESTLHPDEFFVNEMSTDKLIVDNFQSY
ncbi:207_t:CDS:2, partial [Racocetra fulgida]